jgi:hypothetical protein
MSDNSIPAPCRAAPSFDQLHVVVHPDDADGVTLALAAEGWERTLTARKRFEGVVVAALMFRRPAAEPGSPNMKFAEATRTGGQS